jgi:peptide/nickel transport system ATP-binding protein
MREVSAAVVVLRDRQDDDGHVPLLQVEDLRVHYASTAGAYRVVDGSSLTVNRHELFGLAGESGCGKSTLVEGILRLIKPPGYVPTGRLLFSLPEAGGSRSVDLMQLSSRQLRALRWRHISYVPQGSMNSLNPVMRIGDQIIDGMVTHGVRAEAARQRVPELLGLVGLQPELAHLFPHELSGGMKQRAIIAAAVALNPQLVVADEPTTALDVNVQRVVLQTLAHLRRELGVAIIIVSHDLPVHAQLVDRMAIMYAGRIVEVGSVQSVFQSPLHPYTRGLVASIPAIGGPRERLPGIPGVAPSPLSWPAGCRFHPRCPYAMEVCRRVEPLLTEIPPGPHVVAGQSVTVSAGQSTACHLFTPSSPEQPNGR